MPFQWKCPQCGQEQISEKNICENRACRYVLLSPHGTHMYDSSGKLLKVFSAIDPRGEIPDDVVCARCGQTPYGNSDFPEGCRDFLSNKNVLRVLTMKELMHPEYEAFGTDWLLTRETYMPYVGKRLCYSCHPYGTIKYKLWTEGVQAEDVIQLTPEEIELFGKGKGKEQEVIMSLAQRLGLSPHEAEQAFLRWKAFQFDQADRETKAKLVSEIKHELERIKKRRPDLDESALRAIAASMIKKAKNPAVIYESLDRRVRKAIRPAVPSKVSFRKNLPIKEVKYRAIYDWQRIAKAVYNGNLKAVLKDELEKCAQNVKRLLDDASRGQGIAQLIDEVTETILFWADKAALADAEARRAQSEVDELKPQIDYWSGKVESLKDRLSREPDAAEINRLNVELHRAQYELTQCWQRAEGVASPTVERAKSQELYKRIWALYRPMLDVLRRIYPFSKDELWNGLYHQMGTGPTKWNMLQFTGGVSSGTAHVDDTKEDYPYTGPGIVREDFPKPQCEFCGKEGDDVKAVPRPVVKTEVIDLSTKGETGGQKQEYHIAPKNSPRKAMILLCSECIKIDDLHAETLIRRERGEKARLDWLDEYEEEKRRRLVQEHERKENERKTEKAIRVGYRKVLLEAAQVMEKAEGVTYVAPILHYDHHAAYLSEFILVVVHRDDRTKIPKTIPGYENLGVTIFPCTDKDFEAAYLYAALNPIERTRWIKHAKKMGFRFTWGGLVRHKDSRIYSGVGEIVNRLQAEKEAPIHRSPAVKKPKPQKVTYGDEPTETEKPFKLPPGRPKPPRYFKPRRKIFPEWPKLDGGYWRWIYLKHGIRYIPPEHRAVALKPGDPDYAPYWQARRESSLRLLEERIRPKTAPPPERPKKPKREPKPIEKMVVIKPGERRLIIPVGEEERPTILVMPSREPDWIRVPRSREREENYQKAKMKEYKRELWYRKVEEERRRKEEARIAELMKRLRKR